MTFRTYLVINYHGRGNDQKDKAAAFSAKFDPDYVVGSECFQMTSPMKDAGFYVHPAVGTTRGLEDVAIYTKKPIHSEGQLFVSPDLHRPIAPDRWTKFVRRYHRVTMAGHWNAVIQDKDGTWKDWLVANQAKLGARRIVTQIKSFQVKGLKPVYGGDANWNEGREPNKKVFKYSPEWVANQCNMGWVNRERMWLMWDKKHYKLSDVRVIPRDDVPTGTHDDAPHLAMLVTLEYL